jgi:hypothetical protein
MIYRPLVLPAFLFESPRSLRDLSSVKARAVDVTDATYD